MKKLLKKLIHAGWFPSALALVLVCLILTVFTGISKSDSPVSRALATAFMPIERAITNTAADVADVYNGCLHYTELKAEKEELEQRVAELTGQLETAQAAITENAELKEMLGVAERNTNYTYESARVIGRTLDEWSSGLTIDAGSAEGLSKYDCVVTPKGMVGYINEVSEHSAQVTTVIDSNMSAGARLTRTGVLGVAEGKYQLMTEGQLKVSYLSKGSDAVVGDTVQTSGIGGIYPPGLMIGTISAIRTESDGMSNYAVLDPVVDITTLTHVYIITSFTTAGE